MIPDFCLCYQRMMVLSGEIKNTDSIHMVGSSLDFLKSSICVCTHTFVKGEKSSEATLHAVG